MFKGLAYDLIDAAIGDTGLYDQTMHMIGNMLIELHGDSAVAETHAQAYHRVGAKDGQPAHDVVMGTR